VKAFLMKMAKIVGFIVVVGQAVIALIEKVSGGI